MVDPWPATETVTSTVKPRIYRSELRYQLFITSPAAYPVMRANGMQPAQ